LDLTDTKILDCANAEDLNQKILEYYSKMPEKQQSKPVLCVLVFPERQSSEPYARAEERNLFLEKWVKLNK